MEQSKNFLPTNMTVVCELSDIIDLDVVSKMLTRVPVNFKIKIVTNTREKVPFFGVNGCIIGIRYKGASCGIRVGGKQLNNCVAIDLQCCNKNVHLKLSPKKMTCVGVLSKEMGEESFGWILSYIQMVNGHWKHFHSLSSILQQDTLRWITEIMFKKSDDVNDDLYMFDDPIILELFDFIPDNVDYTTAKYLSMFTYDAAEIILLYQSFDVFISKIRKFYQLNTLEEQEEIVRQICQLYKNNVGQLSFEEIWEFLSCNNQVSDSFFNKCIDEIKYQQSKVLTPYQSFLDRINTLLTFGEKDQISKNICYVKEPTFGNVNIENSVFNYNLGTDISLIKVCSELHKRGFNVGFHNWNSHKSLIVTIPLNMIEEIDEDTDFDGSCEIKDDDEIIEEMINDKKANKAHTFQIYQRGSIRQTSPTLPHIAYQIKKILVDEILSIVN